MPIMSGEGKAPEVDQDEVYYLSSEVLKGKKVKPGDTLMLKVTDIGDGEIGVTYGEDETTDEMNPEMMGQQEDQMLKSAFSPQ